MDVTDIPCLQIESCREEMAEGMKMYPEKAFIRGFHCDVLSCPLKVVSHSFLGVLAKHIVAVSGLTHQHFDAFLADLQCAGLSMFCRI